MPMFDTPDTVGPTDWFDAAAMAPDAAPPAATTRAGTPTSPEPAADQVAVTDSRRGLRLLHTADWQIGKPYNNFPTEDGVMLVEARFQVVERIARHAQAEEVDAVLVAGDVFDAQGLSDRTIHRLFHSLAAFSGPWLMLPGNHDAALSESIWSRAQRLGCVPDNVHLCLTPRVHLFEPLRMAILPAPLTQRHTHHDLTEWFAQADTPPGWWRIGLAHGSVQGILADDIDSSNPIAPDRADQAALDYLALGDWHGTRRIDARTWYSGTPETDRFRANDSGQILLVSWAAAPADNHVPRAGTARRELPTVVPLPFTQYRWRAHAASLQVDSDLDALLQDVAALQANDVVQYQVAGQVDLAGQQRLQRALDRAQGRARSVTADMRALRLQPTAEDIAALHADGYLGDVIATLRDVQEQPDVEKAECAHDALVLLAGMLQPGEDRQ
ncbi:DNA repair exonuclease [Robbsia andropogonis]|nr:DNA repair exonuclease [Robbsia andropogonis]